MISSIYTIMMGETAWKIPQEPLSFKMFNILYLAIGGIIILKKKNRKQMVEKNRKIKYNIIHKEF